MEKTDWHYVCGLRAEWPHRSTANYNVAWLYKHNVAAFCQSAEPIQCSHWPWQVDVLSDKWLRPNVCWLTAAKTSNSSHSFSVYCHKVSFYYSFSCTQVGGVVVFGQGRVNLKQKQYALQVEEKKRKKRNNIHISEEILWNDLKRLQKSTWMVNILSMKQS